MPATAVGSANGRSTSASTSALAREPVAHQHPGDEQPEDGVDQRGDQRGAEGELVGGERARVR